MASPNYSQQGTKRKYEHMSQPDTPSMDEDYDPFSSDGLSEESEEEWTPYELLQRYNLSTQHAHDRISTLEKKVALLTRMVQMNCRTRYNHHSSWDDDNPPPPAIPMVKA